MAQKIKFATQLIAIDDLIHATNQAISGMIPDKYLYYRADAPAEYEHIMKAQSKLYEATQEINKAKKLIKPDITNLNISKRL